MNMKRFKNLIPEIYFLVSVTYYWIMTGTLFNPWAITLLSMLAILIWSKNLALGIVISSVVLALNLFLVLALISELKEFTEFDKNAMTMLAFGLGYIGLNIFMSIRMLIWWINTNSVTTVSNI